MYVDAIFSRKDSKVKVVERINGQRVYREYPGIFEFYVEDSKGRFKSIYGEPITRIQCNTHGEMQKAVRINSHKKTYESDIKPVNKILERHYKHQNVPDLHVAFFDIETDFDKDTGYSSPEEATCPIISVAVHLQWLNQTVCLAVPPKGISMPEAQQIADDLGDVILFHDEAGLLEAFLTVIEDADVLSGWYSEGYDLPFTTNRIMKVLGRAEARRLCLWDQMPKPRTFSRGGQDNQTYDIFGRVHLDYLQLYKKFTYEERHSFALDAIGQIEVDERKVPYDGTLDELYNKDFKKFLEYNIQDAELIDKLDKKLQFIDLAAGIAHGNCVLVPAALGAVAVTEQAVILEAHERNMMVPDRVHVGEDDLPAAGGWVQCSKKGLHKWIGNADLKSLYPSVIRALNMSPETLVGQLRLDETDTAIRDWIAASKKNTFTTWWNDRFNTLEMEDFLANDKSNEHYLDLADGSTVVVTGAELRAMVFDPDSHLNISANGTIFRNDIEGIIPGLLGRWYNERKRLQKIAADYKHLRDGISLDLRKDIIENIQKQIETADPSQIKAVSPYDPDLAFSIATLKKKAQAKNPEGLLHYMLSQKIAFKNGKVTHTSNDELGKIIGFWSKRQLVRKINLNSVYGGLLNIHCRFYDRRLGQSTTLTGRSISRHMSAKTNEIIDGIYDYSGRAILYGDTDSTYFSAYEMLKDDIDSGKIEWTKESVIELYDTIAQQASDTFPAFLRQTFNVPETRGKVIASAREIVATTGLFITKKRYALLIYDDDGIRKDVDGKQGAMKAVGLDLRRSDTPVIVQDFLKDILLKTLELKSEDDVIQDIREFKKEFELLKPWEKGAPTAVNNITSYSEKLEHAMKHNLSARKMEKVKVPGHVMASINWNLMRESHHDFHLTKILDGSKVVVCKLKPGNDTRKTSIAFPVEELHLPDWFVNLPFDNDAMMESIVDKKVENLLGVLRWDLSRTSSDAELMETYFDFSAC